MTAPDGEIIRSVLDQYVRHALARLTYQIDARNKLASFFQRTWKRKGKDFGFGTDPRAATHRDPHQSHMGIGNVKYTGTWSSRVLIEAGYSTNYAHQIMNNQPGDSHERLLPNGQWNPVWFANARKTDTALNINPECAYAFGCTAWISNGSDRRVEDTRKVVAASVSYVTGSHNFKAGIPGFASDPSTCSTIDRVISFSTTRTGDPARSRCSRLRATRSTALSSISAISCRIPGRSSG